MGIFDNKKDWLQKKTFGHLEYFLVSSSLFCMYNNVIDLVLVEQRMMTSPIDLKSLGDGGVFIWNDTWKRKQDKNEKEVKESRNLVKKNNHGKMKEDVKMRG